jgi:hypothetical protein
MTTSALKNQLRALGESMPEPTRIRVHRAISWLARADAEKDDPDAKFLFLWIAFNAAYAREFGQEQSERDQLKTYFASVLALDSRKQLHAVLFREFSGPIRTLIENKFVFEPFWRALREHDGTGRWEQQFTASRTAAMKALMGQQTDVVLSILFDRLYVLRNQLAHGGATWNSKTNRAQVRDSAHMLAAIVPVLVGLMLENPKADFGEIMYPVV